MKSKIHLPKDWQNTSRLASVRQYAFATIIIGNSGKAVLKPESIKINVNNQNKKYTERIVGDIKTGINSMVLWTPAKLNGHNVSSKVYVDIYLDNP